MKYLQSIVVILFCVLTFLSAQAQTVLPLPKNFLPAYDKGTRTESGRPGKHYWQNTADYVLNIQFNPQTRVLQGLEDAEYVNNSPDTLREIIIKLYPNLYKKGSQRTMTIHPEDINDGVGIDKIESDNNNLTDTSTDGTNLYVKGITLLPSAKIHLTIQYHYTLNAGSHIRTGEIEPGANFIAYFFPRIAVYDDIDGWNENPYLGTQEFYNDFCHFNVNISVPNNYIVWCTGKLMNAKDVLSGKHIQRLQQAEKSDEVTTIIDTTDIRESNITKDSSTLTWHFEVNNVTDVAFALSNHYIWQASSLIVDTKTGRRTRVDAVFNPKHNDYFDVVHYARKTVEAMSFTFPQWPYPYPHETVFDGLDQMEYPMMVNDNPLEDKEASIELTDHEIFHTMFPFYMGINETQYAWMDEGWATIGEWMISPMIDSSIVDNYGVSPYENAAGTNEDLPIATLSTQLNGTAYFLNSYPKPAFGYLYIKDMLGDKLFMKALHNYITLWNGKHPTPFDFFNCMNEGAGRNMNWFWKRWYFDNGTPDLAINNVMQKGENVSIIIMNKGGKPLPIDLNIYFTDSTSQKTHTSIECWKENNLTSTIHVTTKKKIKKIVLGSTYTPDAEQKDNLYIPE